MSGPTTKAIPIQQQQQILQDYYRDINMRHTQQSVSPSRYNETPDSRAGLLIYEMSGLFLTCSFSPLMRIR